MTGCQLGLHDEVVLGPEAGGVDGSGVAWGGGDGPGEESKAGDGR